ncbi:RluA family pseudouridine synthase [Flavobacterium sp. I3-2]|uniref:RluA family pseudouridine synthase n=1 Tax=Flavobacterium sp. I3-2 TaxID=2748319 RepID=UPI0015AE9251|nr:RluA family pseudouridine synthase [Flavobacterium sp. I3-2]
MNKFKQFSSNIDSILLPEKFTFPFFYEPHPLCVIATNELQEYLLNQTDFEHNFGLFDSEDAIGKMFGVLVVQNKIGEIGYLTAFSGKMANSNVHDFFVPPVFDMLDENGFFIKEQSILNDINDAVKSLENDANYLKLKSEYETFLIDSEKKINEQKLNVKRLKNERKQLRKENIQVLSAQDYEQFEADLVKQSLRDKHEFNVFMKSIEDKINEFKSKITSFQIKINELKDLRKNKSNALQKQLFESYSFLNALGIRKNLLDIFSENGEQPPAAAGECCAPKLLQYAFLNDLKPLAMAEFWWGTSPKSEIKKHQNFYPACWGKCKPILGHMLAGLSVDDNPFLVNSALDKDLEIIYDDEFMVVINKPADFLSVPGIHVKDSVYERIKMKYINATGPLIIHRLDMPTSGLLVLAKSKEAHKILQSQFIKRTVVKKYIALLEGVLTVNVGEINLPIRLDLDDRPRQLVCEKYGKNARTKYEIIEIKNNRTKVYFYPITGRTHQLRVHASHHLGLNTPIVGDDLYGKSDRRLHLHAAYLELNHPVTNQRMFFEASCDF